MALIKTKAIVAFKHVLNNVFEVPEDGPLAKALAQAGYDNIWTVVTLQDEDIEALTFDRSAMDKVLDLVLHCLYLPSCTNDHVHIIFVLQLHTFC